MLPSTAVGLHEDTVALQVDDLLGFGDGERNRVFPAMMGIGPDETVFLHPLGRVFLDDPGGLVEAVRSVWGRPDAVTLVFNRRRGRPFPPARCLPADESAPCRFELREHGSCSLRPLRATILAPPGVTRLSRVCPGLSIRAGQRSQRARSSPGKPRHLSSRIAPAVS